jgi:hypothetical protein
LCTPFPCTTVCSINTHKQQRSLVHPLSVHGSLLYLTTQTAMLSCALFPLHDGLFDQHTKSNALMGPLSVARWPALSNHTNSNAPLCPLSAARRPARRARKLACACAGDDPRCFSTCLCLAHVLAMLRLCCSMCLWLGPMCRMSSVAVSRAGACRRRGRWRTFGRGSAGCGQQPSVPAWLPRTSCLQRTPPCMRCGSRWPIGRQSTLSLGLGCWFCRGVGDNGRVRCGPVVFSGVGRWGKARGVLVEYTVECSPRAPPTLTHACDTRIPLTYPHTHTSLTHALPLVPPLSISIVHC